MDTLVTAFPHNVPYYEAPPLRHPFSFAWSGSSSRATGGIRKDLCLALCFQVARTFSEGL